MLVLLITVGAYSLVVVQVNDLRNNLNTINGAAREVPLKSIVFKLVYMNICLSYILNVIHKLQVKESAKLRQIMQTILTLGNALNQGTARGTTI